MGILNIKLGKARLGPGCSSVKVGHNCRVSTCRPEGRTTGRPGKAGCRPTGPKGSRCRRGKRGQLRGGQKEAFARLVDGRPQEGRPRPGSRDVF